MGHSELFKQNATRTTYAKCLNKRPQENEQQASLIFRKPLLFSMRFLDYTSDCDYRVTCVIISRPHHPLAALYTWLLTIIAPNTIFSNSALHHFVMVAAKFLPNIECNAGCIFQRRQLRDASYLLSSKLFAALPPRRCYNGSIPTARLPSCRCRIMGKAKQELNLASARCYCLEQASTSAPLNLAQRPTAWPVSVRN